jgi:hypothetical protein
VDKFFLVYNLFPILRPVDLYRGLARIAFKFGFVSDVFPLYELGSGFVFSYPVAVGFEIVVSVIEVSDVLQFVLRDIVEGDRFSKLLVL